MTLASKAHEAKIEFIDDCRTEGMNVSDGKLQVVVRLFLIKFGECRRKSLSHAAIVWSIFGESAKDGVSRSKLVVDSRSQGVDIGNTAWMANVVSGWIGVVGDRIQVGQGGANRVNLIRRNYVSGKRIFSYRIYDGHRQTTEVSCALLQGRHQRCAGDRLPTPRSFIGKHPK